MSEEGTIELMLAVWAGVGALLYITSAWFIGKVKGATSKSALEDMRMGAAFVCAAWPAFVIVSPITLLAFIVHYLHKKVYDWACR